MEWRQAAQRAASASAMEELGMALPGEPSEGTGDWTQRWSKEIQARETDVDRLDSVVEQLIPSGGEGEA